VEVVTGAAEAAQQYFHTYKIPIERQDVALKEYDLSVQSLSGDQRSIALATGLTVVAVGFIGTVVSSDNGLATVTDFLNHANRLMEWGLYLSLTAIALISLRYFAELQRSATHAARKIVVLRRLLGVDYGNIEKVMPTETLEGANEPYAIPMFPGWGEISSLATLLVAPFAAGLLLMAFGLFVDVPKSSAAEILEVFPNRAWAELSLFVSYCLFLLATFRFWLLEKWEDKRFVVGRSIAAALNCPFKDRMGHVLYRMELAVFEARRIGIDLRRFHPIAIRIEDRRFLKHRGNDWIAIARAVWQRIRLGFVSGGSTIDQQLFRSTCLRKIERRWTRKIVEWLMAPWLAARYEKHYILDMYLCSARFDRGVIGIAAAISHFFDTKLHSQSRWLASHAQIIFLVERLSNISQTIPVNRIRAIIVDLKTEQLIADSDVTELEDLYISMIARGRVKGRAEEINFRVH